MISAQALTIAAFALVMCLQINLAWGKPINWDEFHHFSLIRAHQRGENVDLFQTPFVHLYGWVNSLPGTTIDHIATIRSLIVPFELLLVGATVICARKFTDRQTALLCGLAYVTAGYAFTQGLALRADIIAASLVMTALAIALHRRLTPLSIAIIVLLAGLAFVSTIKTVLYLPAFLAVAYVRREDVVRWAIPGALAGLSLAVVFLLLSPEFVGELQGKLGGSAQRMFGAGLVPQGRYLFAQITAAPFFTLLLLATVFLLLRGDGWNGSRLVLALFAAPALWPLVYLNAYPYFFAFILPPVAVALVPAVRLALRRYGVIALIACFSLNALALWAMQPRAQLDVQRQVQSDVRALFPEPVVYIDESGMLGDFPRAVPHFASGWALANYRAQGVLSYSERMLSDPVPLLIVNSFALQDVFGPILPDDERLLPADAALIRENYVQQCGMIFVAGKRLPPRTVMSDELVAVPGAYRVEGGSVRINGQSYEDGSTVQLQRGRYALINLSARPVGLRWATASVLDCQPVTLGELYAGY